MKRINIFAILAVAILTIGSFSVFPSKSLAAIDCGISLLDKNGNNTTQVKAGDPVSWHFSSSVSNLKVYWFGSKDGKNDIWNINNGYKSNTTYSGILYKFGEEDNYTRYVAFKNDAGKTICVSPKFNFSVVSSGVAEANTDTKVEFSKPIGNEKSNNLGASISNATASPILTPTIYVPACSNTEYVAQISYTAVNNNILIFVDDEPSSPSSWSSYVNGSSGYVLAPNGFAPRLPGMANLTFQPGAYYYSFIQNNNSSVDGPIVAWTVPRCSIPTATPIYLPTPVPSSTPISTPAPTPTPVVLTPTPTPIYLPTPVPTPALTAPTTSNILSSGQVLAVEATIYSTDRRHSFKFQSDGNLVLYDNSSAIWSSGTSGIGIGGHVVMQSDGNLVLYSNGNAPLWHTATHGNYGAYLLIQDGAFMYTASGSLLKALGGNSIPVPSSTPVPTPIPTPTPSSTPVPTPVPSSTPIPTVTPIPLPTPTLPSSDILSSGEAMEVENPILSSDRRHSFKFQSDGNLVLYDNGLPIWNSGTYNSGIGGRVIMQSDGNLVLYSNNNVPLWNAGTYGNSGAYLKIDGGAGVYNSGGSLLKSLSGSSVPRPSGTDIVGPDQALIYSIPVLSQDSRCSLTFDYGGVLVVYCDRKKIWTTETPGSGTIGIGGRILMQLDGNFVFYGKDGNPIWNSGTFGNPGAYVRVLNGGNGVAIYSSNGVMLGKIGP